MSRSLGAMPLFFFAVSEDLGSMEVPSCQIGPSTLAEILALNPHASASGNWQGRLLATSRLNTGFFVRRDNEFRTMQRFPLPEASVEIEDTPGFASEIGIAWKDPTTVLPGTKGIGTQPTPEGGATDLGNYALSHCLLANIGQGQARQRQTQAMGKLTGESFYMHHDARGEKRAGRPPRGCSSRPGRRARANRLRHLLTIWRGVSKRAAIISLGRPWAARSTILALMTLRYGDVYFRALVSSSFCSSLVRTM